MAREIVPCRWCGAEAYAPVRTIELDGWGIAFSEVEGLACSGCGHLELFLKPDQLDDVRKSATVKVPRTTPYRG
jgi:hypothetical protein